MCRPSAKENSAELRGNFDTSAVFACISNQNVPWASLKAERLRSSSLLRWIGKDFALYRWKGISTIECPKPTAKPNSSNISPEQRLFDLLQIFWTKWCKVNINQSNTKSLATLPSTPQKQVNVILKLCIMTIHFFGGGLMILSSNKENIAYSFPPSNKTPKHPFLTQSKQIPKSSPCPKKTEHITYPKTPKGPANGSVFTRFLQGCKLVLKISHLLKGGFGSDSQAGLAYKRGWHHTQLCGDCVMNR